MLPDEPTDEEKQEELPEDGDTPFRPAPPMRDDTMPPDDDGQSGQSDAARTDDTRPETDTNIQPEELYDEGIDGAAEIEEPNAGNAVTGYNPDKDNDSSLDNTDSHS